MKSKLFHRNFSLLIAGQASSLLGNGILDFAMSMYVLEKTGSAAAYAGFLAASMVPAVLFSPLGGILADRGNKRNIMAGLDFPCQSGRAFGGFVYAGEQQPGSNLHASAL